MLTLTRDHGFGNWLSRWTDRFWWHLHQSERGEMVTACDVARMTLRAVFKFVLVACLAAFATWSVLNQLAFIAMPLFGVIAWSTLVEIIKEPTLLSATGGSSDVTLINVMGVLVKAGVVIVMILELFAAIIIALVGFVTWVWVPTMNFIGRQGRTLSAYVSNKHDQRLQAVQAGAVQPGLLETWYYQFKEKVCVPVTIATR